jgi:hypothetical protein
MGVKSRIYLRREFDKHDHRFVVAVRNDRMFRG